MFHHNAAPAAPAPVSFVEMAAAAGVAAGEAASLHRHLFAGASLDRAEAESLFDLERAGLNPCEAWTVFFVEALTDHLVWGERPTGRLGEEQARWLMDQVDAARTPASFALLVNVIDAAQQVPAWFPAAVRARAAAGWPGVSREADTFSRPLRVAA